MILRLPKGYDTEIGEGGAMLSSGQRQRIGLARACTGRRSWSCSTSRTPPWTWKATKRSTGPSPPSRKPGRPWIVGHRPSTLAQADRILMLREGRLHMFGPRADVIERLTRHQVQAVAPAKTQPVPQTAS